MEFPLNYYLPELQRVLSSLPDTSIITVDILSQLTEADIEALKIIVYYTFPNQVSQDNFACLDAVVMFIYEMITTLEDGAYIIAPGDSPSKFIALINALFYDPISGKYRYQIGSDIIEKEFTFITFPLSQIHYWSDVGLSQYVAGYIHSLLDKGRPYLGHVWYMDYTDSRATLNRLTGVMSQLLNDPDFKFKTFILNEHWDADTDCGELMEILFAEAEPTNCRCVSRLYHDLQEETFKTTRCNMIIALIYFRVLNRLGNLPMIRPKLTRADLQPYLEQNQYYLVKIYDEADSILESLPIKVGYLGSESLIFNAIIPNTDRYPEMEISLNSILEILPYEL